MKVNTMQSVAVASNALPCYPGRWRASRRERSKGEVTYLTVAEVAERLKVYPGTVKRWLRDGRLVGVSLGDRAGWRIAEDDLQRFLRSQSNVRHVAERDALEGKTAA
jgi:excisionase family DNA binding protein